MGRIFRRAIVFLVFAGCSALAQSSEGTLTVSGTVVTSVSLMIDADGRKKVVLANAADPADNVSQLVLVNYALKDPSSSDLETSKIEGAVTNVTDATRKQIRRGLAISYRRSVQCRGY
jgi:hypothetical protein